MKKRDFLKTAGILGAGLIISPAIACSSRNLRGMTAPVAAINPSGNNTEGAFTLPPLGYSFDALAPAIDAVTMEIHHDKHHNAYVTNLNKAIASAPDYLNNGIIELCSKIKPEETALRNNGGGHYNHSKFWNWIKPGGRNTPTPEVELAIEASFGNFAEFQKQFSDAAKTRFGSGWAWLCIGQDQKLFVTSTANQDNPLMKNIIDKPGVPILGIDVWEHAYYLNYQNRRPDYVSAFMALINWDTVAADFADAKK